MRLPQLTLSEWTMKIMKDMKVLARSDDAGLAGPGFAGRGVWEARDRQDHAAFLERSCRVARLPHTAWPP
jgi:hypothetical protein